jgi:polyisoprenoid-binding protein YceI
MFERVAVAVLVLSLSACAAPRPRPVAPPPIQPFSSLQALPPAGSYQVDSQNSELRVMVYRAGALGNLGHNHVMVNHAVTGVVQVGDSISASSFSLEVPVESFVVDDADARREEGDDFTSDIPEEAKAGTRRNMLSAALLNAAEFPEIRVAGVTLSGTLDALNADLTISVAGREASVSVPFSLQVGAHTLTAVGSLALRQTALGITPYSLLHGALQVEDVMQLKFRIVVPVS